MSEAAGIAVAVVIDWCRFVLGPVVVRQFEYRFLLESIGGAGNPLGRKRFVALADR